MSMRIKDVKRRLLVAKTIQELNKEFASVFFDGSRFGSHADDMALCTAIFIGQAEDRPLNASKLAEQSGIPRATVIRKLASMVAQGSIEQAGSKYTIPIDLLNSDASMKSYRSLRALLVDAASKLSKMDSGEIATMHDPSVTMTNHGEADRTSGDAG